MNALRRSSLVAFLCLGDLFALTQLSPDWRLLIRSASAPRAWVAAEGADSVAAKLAGCGLWLIAVWFGLGMLSAVGMALPGAAGRTLQLLAGRILPRALLRLVAGASGLGVLLAPVAAQAAPAALVGVHSVGVHTVAATPSPTPLRAVGAVVLPAPVVPTDPTSVAASAPESSTTVPASPTTAPATTVTPQPSDAAPTASSSTGPVPTAAPSPAVASGASGSAVPPSAAASTPSPPSSPAMPRPGSRASATTASTEQSVTVAPGDSLWRIAADRLGANGTDAAVALEWPRWYEANAAEIGSDPALIQPGVVLHAPPNAQQ
ncbi:hypothetical protein SAMN05444157_2871 [Frankineae bacterium MT45]|nr:hypothetical protein SAMN05444157_2871 [Frankineae bacterium MT45]